MATATVKQELNIENFVIYLSNRLRPNTVSTYTTALREWRTWLAGRPPSRELAQEYIAHLEYVVRSPNSVLVKAAALEKYFRWTGEPIELDKPRSRPSEIYYLTRDQVSTLIDACHNPLEKVLVILFMDLACRKSELLALELRDIDRINNVVTVRRKGGRIGRINISERGLRALDEWLKARKFSTSRIFNGLSEYGVWEIIHKLGKRVKIRAYPHVFRHSRAVDMLAHGARPDIVRLHLDHKKIATTLEIYGRFLPVDYRADIPSWED